MYSLQQNNNYIIACVLTKIKTDRLPVHYVMANKLNDQQGNYKHVSLTVAVVHGKWCKTNSLDQRFSTGGSPINYNIANII